MEFCPKCGSILMPKKDGKKNMLVCKCGYKDSDAKEVKISEEVKGQKEIEVVDGDMETLPSTKADCPKCGNEKAYYWEVQTRAADEPATKFLKCEKCKHIWRDYS